MPKFKVGQWVTLEGASDKLKLKIISIMEDTCSGGKQIHYNCRLWIKEYSNQWLPATTRNGIDLKKYNEIEIVPYVEKLDK